MGPGQTQDGTQAWMAPLEIVTDLKKVVVRPLCEGQSSQRARKPEKFIVAKM